MNTKTSLITLVIGSLFTLLIGFAAADNEQDSPPIPSVEDRVKNADLIVFMTVTNATTSSYINDAGQKVKVLTGDTIVERVLKGTPPKILKVKQEIIGDDSARTQLKNGSYLARLKSSGDVYIPCDYYGLGIVAGKGFDDDNRVVWPECYSVAEAVAAIERALKK